MTPFGISFPGTIQEAAPILLGGLRRRDFLDIDVVRKARLHNRILWVPKPGYEGVDAVADKNPVQITVSRNHTALSMTAIKEAIQVRAVWNSTIYSDGLHSLTLSA